MDDYISKPIQAQKLFDLIEAAAPQNGRGTTNGHAPRKALDRDTLIKNFDGDLELLLTVAKVFAGSFPRQLSDCGDAVVRGEPEALAYAAHTLKGSVGTFCARAAVDAAAELERIGQSGNLSSADGALAALVNEIERVGQELSDFVKANEL
jgi:HPt (histidine-containing phosphotransfer) domain-containing protein